MQLKKQQLSLKACAERPRAAVRIFPWLLSDRPPLDSLFTVDVGGFPPETQVLSQGDKKSTFKENKSQPNVADLINNYQPLMGNDVLVPPCPFF